MTKELDKGIYIFLLKNNKITCERRIWIMVQYHVVVRSYCLRFPLEVRKEHYMALPWPWCSHLSKHHHQLLQSKPVTHQCFILSSQKKNTRKGI